MNIAIVSVNREKYSETFIHNHIKHLPGNVHLLFDGFLPKQYSSDRGATSTYFLNSPKLAQYAFKNKIKERLVYAIESYILTHQIEAILCEYGPAGVEMMELAKKTGIPLIVHFHGYDAYRKDVLDFYGSSYVKLFAISRTVISVSQHMSRQLIALGCSSSKLLTLCYGVDTNIFKFKLREHKNPVFVACGRFTEKKAPNLTIRAFEKVLQKMPGATLIMIGDGELLNDCKALTKALHISGSVFFKGVLPPVQIAEEFGKALVFIQHSVTAANGDSEGTPLAILEAMASGLPVVSTNHGGIPDIVIHGKTGLLVSENDVDGMAQQMLWLAENAIKALEMGQAASIYVHENFTLNRYTKQLSEIVTQSSK